MQGRIEIEDKIELGIQEKLENYPPFVAEWYYSLRAKGNTVKSCRSYINKLEHFITTMNYDFFDFDVDEITQKDLAKYFIAIQYKDDGKGNKIKTSGAYLNSVWFALNNFFEYERYLGRIEINYMETVKPVRSKKNITNSDEKPLLKANDFKKMLCNVPGTSSILKRRNKAILLIYMTTGIRRDALCQINISDIDFKERKLAIIDKGEKKHLYTLNEEVLEAINQWIDVRDEYNKDSDALFVTYQGKRMTGNSIFNMVEQCSKKALGYSIGPHKLRAGLCSILYDETGDIEFVRRAIGHSNIATTQKYIVTEGDEKQIAADIMSKII